MCDQTEVQYLPGDVVWVKLGPVWWPGIVCHRDEVPEEIFKNLRKEPIAIVKFFQEDSFEYVQKLTNIYHYNCLKKNEFIKKGLDMSRSRNRDAPSNMKLFPEDVARAEMLTNGNPNILHHEMFQPEEKPTYTDLFGNAKKTPKKVKPDNKKKTPLATMTSQNAPRIITHPRFLKLSSGFETDYEARERKQEPLRAECDEEDNSPPTTYRCPDCEFTTIRLNVIVLHNKSHTRNYGTSVPSKAVKRKSSSFKFKERMSNEWNANEADPVKAKIPKTNGTFAKKTPKSPGRKKAANEKGGPKGTPEQPGKKSDKSPDKPKKSVHETDEFQESLLEDWAEYEMADQEALESTSISSSHQSESKPPEIATNTSNSELFESKPSENASNTSSQLSENEPSKSASNTPSQQLKSEQPEVASSSFNQQCKSKPTKSASSTSFQQSESTPLAEKTEGKKPTRIDEEKKKSCFDFDDSEDHIIIDKSKIKFGRKIPRVLEEKVDDTRNLPSDNIKPTTEKEEISSSYEKGLDEQYLSDSPSQSQLQEMGVDNEIEVKTEVGSQDATELFLDDSAEKSHFSDSEIDAKEKEAAELTEKVNKLLEAISAPPKLPELPRSHKKDRLKGYCEAVQNITTVSESSLELNTVSQSNQNTNDIISEPCEPVEQGNCVASVNEIIVPVQDTVECEVEESQPDVQVEGEPELANDLMNNVIEINSSPEHESEEIAIPVTVSSTVNRVQTTPLKMVPKRSPVRFTTTPQLKTINADQVLNAGSRKVKVVPKVVISGNKPVQPSAGKAQPTMTLKTPDGKSFTCSVKPGVFRHRTPATVAATQPRQVSNISLAGSKVRVSPNILQRTSKSAASTGKPQTKVVLSTSTLQMFMQSSNKPAVLRPTASSETDITASQTQSEVMYVSDDGKNFEIPNTNSSNQPLELNYIVDESGNLISLPSVESTTGGTSRKDDILAKALENTDVLQSEMALDASSIVIDSCNVAQNTSVAYKTDAVYENVTLNIPPIMSAYEKPSRALSSTSIADIPNEMIIISGSNDATEYLA